jgi:dTDP-glucose 4,6-dehydratase
MHERDRERAVLVTGGAGFIGSNFVRHLLASTDRSVVVLDKLTYAGHLESLADVLAHRRFEFVRGDIADGASVAALLRVKRVEAVVHLAAETHVDRSIDGPAQFVATNIAGTCALLDATREHLAQRPALAAQFRFVQVSTDEVYGALGDEGSFTERSPYEPNSPYAASKASADHLARAYHRTYGVPTIITNSANNYGPYQFPEKLIPLMVLRALRAETLPIYGDGGHVREWMHVDDHCAALSSVLERGRVGERYNIGAGEERSTAAVVDAVCAALERCAPARDNPALAARGVSDYRALRRFVEDRPGHDRRYAVDARKLRNELRWAPRWTFDEGIVEIVRWYVAHQAWCQSVQRSGVATDRLGLGPRAQEPSR